MVALFVYYDQSVSSTMDKRKVLSRDFKQVIVNLSLKGYSLREIVKIVNKIHFTVNYI